jgi:hypothetical protein
MSFQSTNVKAVDGGYEVTGDLTLHGVTKPVSFTLKGGDKIVEFPKKIKRIGFVSSFFDPAQRLRRDCRAQITWRRNPDYRWHRGGQVGRPPRDRDASRTVRLAARSQPELGRMFDAVLPAKAVLVGGLIAAAVKLLAAWGGAAALATKRLLELGHRRGNPGRQRRKPTSGRIGPRSKTARGF